MAGVVCLLIVYATFSIAPVLGRPGGRYGAPQLAVVGRPLGFTREDIDHHSPDELARVYGLSRLGRAVADNRASWPVSQSFGQLELRQLFFQPTPVADGLCQVRSPIVVLRDTFVFPIGWRLLRSRLLRGEGYPGSPYRYAMLPPPVAAGGSTQPSPKSACATFRDFDNTFIAADPRQAKLLTTLATALVGPNASLPSNIEVSCGYTGPGVPTPCNGRDILATLSPRRLRGMGNWDVRPAPGFIVLRFETPRTGPLPEAYLVFARVVQAPAATNPRVLSVRVVRDCSC